MAVQENPPANCYNSNEKVLKEIDQAVAYGRKHKVHVNLNFHRIPGYCVNPPEEPLNLWKDENGGLINIRPTTYPFPG